MEKQRAPRNRTLTCSAEEIDHLSEKLSRLASLSSSEELDGKVINQDFFDAGRYLPRGFADLIVLDPPYNLFKNFHGNTFRGKEGAEYTAYFRSILDVLIPTLKPNGTVYVCSDWKTSMLIAPVLEERLCVRNRITWEREKGRGAKSNWKNNTEDIWFCTASDSDDYTFNVDAVKLKRKVIAPYRDADGKPKDWDESEDGNYRLTHPSNIWTDITIPFWSMPENTDHPTQKPEKLIAKLILASTVKGGFVFDPFLGSGTTAVVAKKLGRRFAGVEQNTEYCCWTMKRLSIADASPSIQGYADGVFWERNSLADQKGETRAVLGASGIGDALDGQEGQPISNAPRPRGRPRFVKSEAAEPTLNLF
ncbi:site-specific DNA-methyltransferase [Horticoccus luteus]|uniref:Methyltransferase n=1 Tax=Horticoccus luteus TaxID=2862869 RepID=A0A8F9TUC4_9BACT|nr:site-specific DNA-methyltransferase [Horticoccus luteus]QYM78171.1 site-specific DNA-methyltransferase [Horticoccus luteus]